MPVTIPAVELTQRSARCVGIYETNRGGDQSAPQESALDTVAGIHASMATIEQATMGYAVDGFSRFGALRATATLPLSTAEIGAASACCQAVATLLSAVASAHDQGTEADNGTALTIPVIGRRVDHALAQTPSLTEREVVVTVAQQNNPNDPGYGDNVYVIYSRLYPPLIAQPLQRTRNSPC